MKVDKLIENEFSVIFCISHNSKKYSNKDRYIEVHKHRNGAIKFTFLWNGKSDIYISKFR